MKLNEAYVISCEFSIILDRLDQFWYVGKISINQISIPPLVFSSFALNQTKKKKQSAFLFFRRTKLRIPQVFISKQNTKVKSVQTFILFNKRIEEH